MGGYAFFVYPFSFRLAGKDKILRCLFPLLSKLKTGFLFAVKAIHWNPFPPVFQSYITALAVYFRNHIGVGSQIVTVKLWMQDRFFMLLVAIIGNSFE